MALRDSANQAESERTKRRVRVYRWFTGTGIIVMLAGLLVQSVLDVHAASPAFFTGLLINVLGVPIAALRHPKPLGKR